MSSDLPEAARAFVEGDVALLPSALAEREVEQLVRHLLEQGDAVRLQRLAESPDKKLAKPARRGLHLLRTRGQSVPPPEKREFRLRGPYAEEAEPPGLVSLIDGHGERVVWLVRTAQHGFDVYQVELSETRGIIGFQVGNAPKKEWRAHADSVASDRRRVVARASSAHVRWLIEQAYERTVAAGRTPPEDFARARLDLGPVTRPERHPARELAPPLDGMRERLASLHELPEIALWVPSKEAMDRLDLELGQISTSALVVKPGDRAEQIARLVDQLADELTPALRAQLADRLEETALILHDRGQPDEARLCTTAADLVRDESTSGASNPFLRQLFEKLIKKETP